MTECAIMIALATILSLIKVFEMPWGGSITAASMLPLVIIGYRHGIKWGVLSSVIYSLIQMILGGGTISAAFLPGDDQMKWYLAVIMVLLGLAAMYLNGETALTPEKKEAKKHEGEV